MNKNDKLAERFEEQRAQLRAIAYRMLGPLAEADDALQDAWIQVEQGRDKQRREPLVDG